MREKVLLSGEQSLNFKDTLLESPNNFPKLFNHTGSITCFRSIVKEVTHA